LYMAMELSDKKWVLALSDGVRAPSRHTLEAGDTGAILGAIAKARLRCGLGPSARVHSCYEAGRDGFWLHRWLVEQGIDNIVVDAASIEVDRRARRTKTDRTDVMNLHRNLLRYRGGEGRVWAVARVPTVEQEDARRPLREAQRLQHEANAHRNRIGSLLVLHGMRSGKIGRRGWAGWWALHAGRLPEAMRAEIEREVARLALVKAQSQALQEAQRQAMAVKPQVGEAAAHAVARQLCTLGGIGRASAWRLDKEWLGWRHFDNRREVAASVGLTGSPYNSGDSQVEQGITKVGNKRVRWLLVELAWCWLRYQPQSELTRWYNVRFAHGGKRMRRIGIVALARRLAIALWRYVEQGVLPVGARLKVEAGAA
jgi:transposase